MREIGDMEGALTTYREALAIYQKLVDADPASSRLKSELAQSHDNVGNMLTLTGQPEEARGSSNEPGSSGRGWPTLADPSTNRQSDIELVYCALNVSTCPGVAVGASLAAQLHIDALQDPQVLAHPGVGLGLSHGLAAATTDTRAPDATPLTHAHSPAVVHAGKPRTAIDHGPV